MTFKMTAINSYPEGDNRKWMTTYRAVVATRYQPCGHTQIRDVIRSNSFIVSRKIDGELWFVLAEAKGPLLVAANGRTIADHPILNEAKSLPTGAIIAGELYVPNETGRERVGDVAAALAKNGEKLKFAAFDLVSDGEQNFHNTGYPVRVEYLKQHLTNGASIEVVNTSIVSNVADLEDKFTHEIQAHGYEGLIVRGDDGRAFKIKEERTVDAAILGFTERDAANGGLEVRSLLLGLSNNENQFILVGVAGNIGPDVDRQGLHAQLKNLVVASEYRHAASTGQVYQMVDPSIIAEVKVVDIQVNDSKGLPMKQPVLEYSAEGFKSRKPIDAVTLINANAIRIRDDKQVEADGASWRQVEDVAPMVASQTVELPSSEVIRRQVWTKGSDDKVDVRKLVVWKTNKDDIDANYPAYVVHWTDYSKGRKSPLDREVKPAANEKSAFALANKMVEENIKKGWVEFK